MRIAATADLHFTPARFSALHDQLNRVRDEADVFVLAGDLTNYGRPDEMEPLLNVLVRLRVPTIAVLGNHDYESGREGDLMRMLSQRYPAYNWANNAGYSTEDHRNAIIEVGLTPHHRRSFEFNNQLELL